MEKYLLTIMGSCLDSFYETDSIPVEGDFSHVRFLKKMAGGCPLNVGAVCASKGKKVKALDMLGKEDESTDFLLKEMERLSLDTENIVIKKGVVNGQVLLFLTKAQRTMFIIDPIRPAFIVDEKMQELLNHAQYIYSLMHMINRSFSSLDPLIEAKRNGARIILDGSSKYDDPSRVKILYELADGLFINETDYERLRHSSEGEPKDIILSNGGQFVVVTHGSKGSTLYRKDETLYKETLRLENPLDPTGAGDAFAGCFLACLMEGMSYHKALSYASVNSAYACTIPGGTGGVASFETLQTFAKENGYEL